MMTLKKNLQQIKTIIHRNWSFNKWNEDGCEDFRISKEMFDSSSYSTKTKHYDYSSK